MSVSITQRFRPAAAEVPGGEQDSGHVAPSGPAFVPPAVVRVNLLPGEIAQGRQLRAIQAGIAGSAVLVTLGVGALWLHERSSLGSARDSQQGATLRGEGLQNRVNQFAYVDKIFSQTDAAQKMLAGAGAGTIRWSRFMRALSTDLPADSWLTNVTFTGATSSTSSAAAATTPGAAPAFGSVSLSGNSATNPGIADLLDDLGQVPGFGLPSVSSSTRGTTGSTTSYGWSITVPLTAAALGQAEGTTP